MTSPLRALPIPVLALALIACTESHEMTDSGVDAPAHDAGPRDTGVDAVIAPPPGAIVCGGALCDDGEECCLLDGRCVLAGDPSCTVPPDTTVPRPCARASDCADDELCDAPDEAWWACSGVVGTCRPRDEESCGSEVVCGCDGRTYEDRCAAAAAGVRAVTRAACGNVLMPDGFPTPCEAAGGCGPHAECDLDAGVCVPEDPLIACGIDAQCPPGQACCALRGVCFDPSRPASCAASPDGPSCADDTDCQRLDGTWWPLLTSGTSDLYCAGPGCGPAGGCALVPGDCDGILAPVCGCDGVTYQNPCEAASARVRVAHDGAC